jgi:AbrB family looped-hinge helix DNA binding protein
MIGGSMKSYSITAKGQVTVPLEIREKLKLKPGDKVIYQDTQEGVLLKPAKRNMLADFGFLEDRQKSKKDLDLIRKAVREKIAKRA